MPTGLDFEREVADELRKMGVQAVTHDRWDHDEKTDYAVLAIDGRRCRFPIEVQVTLRRNDIRKLRQYLAHARLHPRDVVRLYLEPAVMHAWRAAVHIKDALADLAALKHRALGDPYGLRIYNSGDVERFSPAEKLEELERLADPVRSAGQRRTGIVTGPFERRITIVEEHGGDRWSAGRFDIVDDRLRRALRGTDRPIRVSFIPAPHAHEKGCALFLTLAPDSAPVRSGKQAWRWGP